MATARRGAKRLDIILSRYFSCHARNEASSKRVLTVSNSAYRQAARIRHRGHLSHASRKPVGLCRTRQGGPRAGQPVQDAEPIAWKILRLEDFERILEEYCA